MTPTTTPELADLLRPFVNSKLNPPRSPEGYAMQQRHRITILHRACSIGLDIRDVTERGVLLYFYGDCHLVLWADIRRVTIEALDDDAFAIGTQVFEHVPALRVAA